MVTIKLNGQDREIRFSFKVWKNLEDEFGGMQNALSALSEKLQNEPMTMIPHLIFISLRNKTEDETEEKILDYIDEDYSMKNLTDLVNIVQNAIKDGLPEDDSPKNARMTVKK